MDDLTCLGVAEIVKPAIQRAYNWFGNSWKLVNAFVAIGKIMLKMQSRCVFS